MLDIKFREADPPTAESTYRGEFVIVVNGTWDSKSDCYILHEEHGWYCRLSDQAVFNQLTEYSFEEVGKHLFLFSRYFGGNLREVDYTAEIRCRHDEDLRPGIILQLNFIPEFWARPYSIYEFGQLIKHFGELDHDAKSFEFEGDLPMHEEFNIFLPIQDKGEIIKPAISKAVAFFRRIEHSAEIAAINAIDKENLVTYFSFPEHIKTACKQYLIYFAQFLLDLGIEAETEVVEQAGQTLFKVIPADKADALDKIKDALKMYLNAPAAPESELRAYSNADVAAMQWQANIMHLKSQLMFANAALQMKDASIEALQLSNYQYKQLVIQYGHKEHIKNEEDVVPGILAVKKYEGKGFSIDLPEIFRRLKRGLARRTP